MDKFSELKEALEWIEDSQYRGEWDSELVAGVGENYHAVTNADDVVVRAADDDAYSSLLCDYLAAVSPVNIRALLAKLEEAEQRIAELKAKDGHSSYHQEQHHECRNRKTFPWVEGRIIPAWVRDLASGPQGCENTYIIAELDDGKQSQGWPQFIAAYIDIRLNRYICGNTAENVSGHVLRYLPFDHREVESQHAE